MAVHEPCVKHKLNTAQDVGRFYATFVIDGILSIVLHICL